MASPAVAAPHRNATMSVDMNLFGSGGGGICSAHYGDAQSMGDGTPKSPKRKADFNQSNAEEEEEEDYCSSSFSSCDIGNEDGREWNLFVGGSSIDESLVQELFGGNRLSMASFCSRPTAPAGPPAVVFPSTSPGSGSCLGGTLHDLFSEGCSRLLNNFQSAVASISIPPPSNISTCINSVNLQQQQQQQQHSTPTSNGTTTPIAIAQPNDHQQQQAESTSTSTSSCTTTSFPSSSSVPTFNGSPDSLVLSVLTEADIARNQKTELEDEQSRVAALEANRRWAETVALWREEMGPRGVFLDCELVDRKQQGDDDDDDISVHEGMVFFCELDGNSDDEEEEDEEEGVDYIDDDDDDDFDVEFIYEEEDESDGMSPQQQQPSQMNAAAVEVNQRVQKIVINNPNFHLFPFFRTRPTFCSTAALTAATATAPFASPPSLLRCTSLKRTKRMKRRRKRRRMMTSVHSHPTGQRLLYIECASKKR